MNSLFSLIVPSQSISFNTLKAEQKVCVEFANALRALTLTDDLPFVWFHIPNEFLPSARKNYSFENKLKHMGKIAGIPDYCFVGAHISFFIEFKTKGNTQSPKQKAFEQWCIDKDIPYYICHTAKEGLDVLSKFIKQSNRG